MEILLELFLKLILIPIGYLIGYVPVVIISLGSLEPGPFDSMFDGGKFYREKGMKFWHLTYVDQDRRYLLSELVSIIGLAILGMAGGLIWVSASFISAA